MNDNKLIVHDWYGGAFVKKEIDGKLVGFSDPYSYRKRTLKAIPDEEAKEKYWDKYMADN